mmetsp:Transcript_140244/g.198775  ORF Transcript_140244/g.198775 Transcript_140244/m.198775 type:complete len:80 (+) Transcript_140244:225-464(+)
MFLLFLSLLIKQHYDEFVFWFVSFTFFSLLCNEMKWKRERRREERNEPTKNTIYLLFSGELFCTWFFIVVLFNVVFIFN